VKEQDIAKAYSKALIELGEKNKVDMAEELTKLSEAINSSNDLENLLFLNVFTYEEKISVLEVISKKLNLSPILVSGLNFLLQEKRMGVLPLIYKEVIVADDHKKGFLRGTIEGSEESIDSGLQKKLADYLESRVGKKAQLDYVKNSNVTAGYKVTVGDLQLDASLDNQLNQLKETILNS
jgi:F-type H+-transporting ATPase subunit delta